MNCSSDLETLINRQNSRNFKTNMQQNIVNMSNLCNCRNKNRCPLDGACKSKAIIYKAEVIDINGQNKTYIGCTEDNFE